MSLFASKGSAIHLNVLLFHAHVQRAGHLPAKHARLYQHHATSAVHLCCLRVDNPILVVEKEVDCRATQGTDLLQPAQCRHQAAAAAAACMASIIND